MSFLNIFKAGDKAGVSAEDLYRKALNEIKAGKTGSAVIFLARAVCNDPDNPDYIQTFTDTSHAMSPKVLNPELKEAVSIALDSPYINPHRLANLWYSLLLIDPGFQEIMNLVQYEDYETFRDQLHKVIGKQKITDPLFLQGLRRLILPHLILERFLTHLRRSLLDGTLDAFCKEEDITALAAALAQYCFYTGYIFNLTDAESEIIAGFGTDLTAREIALRSCYKPLYTHPDAETLATGRFADNPALASMIRQQVTEPLQERDIAQKIPALTRIEDATSRDVQQQYIEFPYPRWQFTDSDKKLSSFFDDMKDKEPDILIAGCGTGQEAMYYSEQFPKAFILAIDLSPASLSYAIRKARERGVQNVEFRQADILALPRALDKKFDIISSSGVLHHMKSPEKGFEALDSLLRPGGLMRICLYSSLGRRHIIETHKIIAEKGYGDSAEAMRAFRQECPGFLPPEILQGITRALDFFIMPQCRDLLFHVMEHQFDIPQIKTLLNKHGYDFLEFILDDPAMQQYHAAYPDDRQATDLDRWAAFEQAHPDTFAAMYKFVCRKRVQS